MPQTPRGRSEHCEILVPPRVAAIVLPAPKRLHAFGCWRKRCDVKSLGSLRAGLLVILAEVDERNCDSFTFPDGSMTINLICFGFHLPASR